MLNCARAQMEVHNVKHSVRRRVQQHYTYLKESGMGFASKSILPELPHSLRRDLVLCLHRKENLEPANGELPPLARVPLFMVPLSCFPPLSLFLLFLAFSCFFLLLPFFLLLLASSCVSLRLLGFATGRSQPHIHSVHDPY